MDLPIHGGCSHQSAVLCVGGGGGGGGEMKMKMN